MRTLMGTEDDRGPTGGWAFESFFVAFEGPRKLHLRACSLMHGEDLFWARFGGGPETLGVAVGCVSRTRRGDLVHGIIGSIRDAAMRAQPLGPAGFGGALAARNLTTGRRALLGRPHAFPGATHLGDSGDRVPQRPLPLVSEPGGRAKPRRVLVPYSGSRTADAALEVAAFWTSALGAEASVLYVRPWDASRGVLYYLETRSEARACTERAELQLRESGLCVCTLVRDANRSRVSETILAVAQALSACLIVLGTQGRGLLSTALVGSTSLRVTRRARCPVILVRTAGR